MSDKRSTESLSFGLKASTHPLEAYCKMVRAMGLWPYEGIVKALILQKGQS